MIAAFEGDGFALERPVAGQGSSVLNGVEFFDIRVEQSLGSSRLRETDRDAARAPSVEAGKRSRPRSASRQAAGMRRA
jgi:hypothetical protein